MTPVPGRRGLEQHAAATEFAEDFMRNGVLVDGHVDHSLLGGFGGLADGLAHFVRLAETDADAAVVVTGDDERAEAEAASALDDLCASVDEDHLLRRFLWFLVELWIGRICFGIFFELA